MNHLLNAMTRLFARLHQSEAGQATILLAVGAMFLVALLAVVGDSAFAFMQRRDLQNTADAAALAGAQELHGTLESTTPAAEKALLWANKNIPDLNEAPAIEFPIEDNYTKIRVITKKDSPGLFGGIGFGGEERNARAAARIASLNTLAPCVVPLGVQQTQYNLAKADPDALVELKLSNADGPNTGLLNLQPGNSATPIAHGSCNNLTPVVSTKPGLTLGDVNNGMADRLEAAIDADCFSLEQILADWPRCRPELLTAGGIQATAVMLLPILDADIIESGAHDMNLASVDSGIYLLAYFWIDGNATYEDPAANKWKCIDHDCVIKGKFLFDLPVVLEAFNQDLCPPAPDECIVEYDPEALIKVVMLDE